jgi:hypothetical protein
LYRERNAGIERTRQSRPDQRDVFYEGNMKGWGPELVKRRAEITMEMVDKFLIQMCRTDPDFLLTVRSARRRY